MTGAELLRTWNGDPFVIALLAIAIVAYGARIRGRAGTRTWFFVGAIAIAVVALVSPLAVLARGYLFSAHMLQHLLLVLVVPPLVWLSLPDRAPAPASSRDAEPIKPRFLEPWLLGIGAMWLWHAPALCNAAAASESVQRVQTISLVAMGTAFWWPILSRRAEHRLAPLGAMAYLFTACVACTILGVIVTFSPVEVCSIYARPVDALGVLPLLRHGWGLGPKADQEIGGLMMWVPACLVYVGGILAMLARYYREPDEERA